MTAFRSPAVDRRTLIAGAAALLTTDGVVAQAEPPRPGRAMTCAAFLDVLGVNLHLGYDNSPYADLERVLAALDLLGVRHARDAAVPAAAAARARYAAVAGRGIRFCMVSGPRRPIDEAMAALAGFEHDHPGAVEAIEWPNEIKPAFAYAGLAGTDAAVRYMSELRLAAARVGLGAKPLVAFTGYARAASDCDYANVHLYPRDAAPPDALFETVLARWSGPSGVMPGKPVLVTELGFHTLSEAPRRPGDWRGVDEETQAIRIMNSWIAAATAGLSRLYLYELLDGDPAGTSQQSRFGLFRADGTAKPAAVAVGALIRRLADGRARSGVRGPRPEISIAAPPSVRWLTLQASDGATFLLFRNTAPASSASSPAAASPAPATVALSLTRPAGLTAWSLVQNLPHTAQTTAHSASLTIGRAPVLVRID